MGRSVYLYLHANILDKCLERLSLGGRFWVRLVPFNALEKNFRLLIPMLISVDDVATVLKYPTGYLSNQPRLIR